MSYLQKLPQQLSQPVDIASLVVLRIGFGLLMLIEVLRYLLAGWVKKYWMDPEFHFTYYGFGWVKVLPIEGMALLMIGLAILSLLILFGKLYRLATIAFFIGFTYLFLLEQARYLNHFYLICLLAFLLMFISPHRTASGTAPAWNLWLMRAQLGLVYFFAGVAKLNGDWLRGEPMRMWLAERQDVAFLGRFFTQEWMVYLFSYGGLLLDLCIAPLLLWRRTRLVAFVAICLFHLLNVRLFHIGIFPWMMILLTTIFFTPEWPRRFLRKLPKPTATTYSLPKWGLALIALFLATQVLLPLRHFLYPGNVSWTEEGHAFAWHMKLRDKEATCEFLIHDPKTGADWLDFPHERLTDWQVRKMAGNPDMLLLYAHWLQEIMAESGFPEVEITCTATCSLNGRTRSPLTDPNIDLVHEPRNLMPKRWVTRHPE